MHQNSIEQFAQRRQKTEDYDRESMLAALNHSCCRKLNALSIGCSPDYSKFVATRKARKKATFQAKLASMTEFDPTIASGTPQRTNRLKPKSKTAAKTKPASRRKTSVRLGSLD